MSRQSLVETLPVLAAVDGQAAYPGEVAAQMKMLGEQVLNAAILAGVTALPLVGLGEFDWRIPAMNFGLVFLTRMALYRGLSR